jgi:hypothetical protein
MKGGGGEEGVRDGTREKPGTLTQSNNVDPLVSGFSQIYVTVKYI